MLSIRNIGILGSQLKPFGLTNVQNKFSTLWKCFIWDFINIFTTCIVIEWHIDLPWNSKDIHIHRGFLCHMSYASTKRMIIYCPWIKLVISINSSHLPITKSNLSLYYVACNGLSNMHKSLLAKHSSFSFLTLC